MGKGAVITGLILALLAAAAAAPLAVSSSSVVSELLVRSGLPFSPVEGRTDTWRLTYSGLENLDELDVFVWARKSSYATIYATILYLRTDPPKALLWRLLELNDSMVPFKYVIRDNPAGQGHLVDCQADLPLCSLSPNELHDKLDDLVAAVDDYWLELNNLL